MVQSPSWAANWFAASQEIPRISRNPKVHYRTHKRPPPVPILGQPNPVHIPTSRLLEIHPNIIHTSTPRSQQWSLSLRFPHQDPVLHIPFVVFVALGIQQVMRMRRILLSYPTVKYFSTLSHKWYDFRENVIEDKMCILISSTTSLEKVSHYKKILWDNIINAHRSSFKVSVILFRYK